MDLSTHYLGMTLRSPLVPSASPLGEKLDNIKRMEDNGAGAVVLPSLFEEQVKQERQSRERHLALYDYGFSEAQSIVPESGEYRLSPDAYLEHIRKAKAAVGIPVIASLNCDSAGWWTQYARHFAAAGADAIELNLYHIETNPLLTSLEVEDTYATVVAMVKEAVGIPVAVKLSPYFTNMAALAKRLVAVGADGLVLFNRFYQPDIDLEALEVRPQILLSTAQDLRLPLRWIAILRGQLHTSFAATSGIHTADDVLKMLLVGANVTMMASALLRHGIEHLRVVEADLLHWMEQHEYISVEQMQGSMSQDKSDDPSAFERAHYIRALQSYKPSMAH